jgi:hypothetical protein
VALFYLIKGNTMHKPRLLKLASFLENTEFKGAKKFDMDTWGELRIKKVIEKPTSSGFHLGSSEVTASRREFKCDTVACALGWATTIPEFSKLGLKMTWFNDPSAIDELDKGDEISGEVKFGNSYSSIEAASKFFDIDIDQANNIFGADQDNYGIPYNRRITPQMVAAKIRKLVRTGNVYGK